jgi:hypothetical protein
MEDKQTETSSVVIDKQAETSSQEPETKSVVALLTSILNEVQKQVLSPTPRPLAGELQTPRPLAGGPQIALDRFTEIVAALELQPPPTITLKADRTQLPSEGGKVTLSWFTTNARAVSINPNVGEVPVADGSIVVSVLATTNFTATATGPCRSATAPVTVNVGSGPTL